ncbi:winged helix-turn-helix domain-containing protein [Microbulbifer hainanensis]|uniref:winged helix-turn-helix domain-containing protein n=1 Tax=Microbulbifer hainanensis TaxID=2735675 RepID=UPI0018672CEA|nr:winged helix-turn-helix domain-containing protein [Microbulbifer hainanensis]
MDYTGPSNIVIHTMRYQLDDLTIDLSRQQVQRGAELLNVSGLSFRLLAYMLQRGSEVVSFDALIDGVWAPSVVNEETVTQRIRLLRAALGDDGRSPRYIRSVRGSGYQLVVVPQALAAEVGEVRAQRQSGVSTGLRRWRSAGLLAVVALAATAAWWVIDGGVQRQPRGPQGDLLARADYYAGIGQRENNERAAALYRQVLEAEPENTHAELGLSFAYSAKVCRYDGDGKWTEKAESLALRALDGEPDNYRAHEALGYALDCRGQVDAAISAYRRAVALAPPQQSGSRTALAYLLAQRGELAQALAMNLSVRDDDPGQTFNDLQLARNYELLGYPAAAETLYARSFALYPDNLFSNVAYPRSLFLQGRYSQARTVLERAGARPVHPDFWELQGEMALLQGDRQRALASFRKAHEARPSDPYFDTLLRLYRVPRADEWIPQRLAALAEQRAQGVDASSLWLEQALLLQAQGATPDAVDALQAAVDRGYRDSAYLLVSPLFADLRGAPEFTQVIDHIGDAVHTQRELVPPELRPQVPL